LGEWSTYVVSAEKLDCGTSSGVTETILPVADEMAMVAGEIVKEPSAWGMTARVDTRMVRGPCELLAVMMVNRAVRELNEAENRVEG
jgi:hypothetical protein